MMSPDDTPAKAKDHENQQQQQGSGGSKKTGSTTTRPQEQGLKCPRCDSPNTKFCYYNNYSLTQPRHFCKTCRRYWTKGGALRNVPIGGGCRKNKKVKSSRLSSCDSRDSGSSSELGGLKFLHGLAAPSLDFHLGGLPFPRLHHHHHPPNTAMFNNQFPSFGDLSATSASVTSASNSCFNLDPSCGTTPSSLIGLNYPFSSSAGTGFSGANAIQGMSTMNINSSLASSIESLSSMNQDLHWKLQQQRLAMVFSGDSNQKDGIVSSQSQVGLEKPQPILFQNLEVSKPEVFNPRKEGPSGNNTVTPTEWFFGNNSYASVAPTPANNSTGGGGGGGGGHGHGHDNSTSNWGGVHAWGDVQQQYTSLP